MQNSSELSNQFLQLSQTYKYSEQSIIINSQPDHSCHILPAEET